ncbi:light-harvesting antenna LH1, alpha subunit [Pararhodospirillum photometricum]|nr:light-harvesting antenna LH1, alpha subunit [Pararhodospirillum photometricum]
MWRVWLLVNPAKALFASAAILVTVVTIIHLFVLGGPLSQHLLKGFIEKGL